MLYLLRKRFCKDIQSFILSSRIIENGIFACNYVTILCVIFETPLKYLLCKLKYILIVVRQRKICPIYTCFGGFFFFAFEYVCVRSIFTSFFVAIFYTVIVLLFFKIHLNTYSTCQILDDLSVSKFKVLISSIRIIRNLSFILFLFLF